MNLEFHYYVTYWIAKKAGFPDSDAGILANSSQFIDEALVSYEVSMGSRTYITPATQDYGPGSESTRKGIHMPFHFIPGDPRHEGARRKDGKENRLNVSPDSPLAKELLIAALKTGDLFRTGIALHSYADTWSHQNFSAANEEWNALDQNSLIPPIGHAQMLVIPDRITENWTDTRLVPEFERVSNRARFLSAAKKIYKYMKTFRRELFAEAESVIASLEKILGPPGREKTENERIFDLIIDEGIPAYSKTWFREAGISEEEKDFGFSGYEKFLKLTKKILAGTGIASVQKLGQRSDFESSALFRWSEAARAHQELTWKLFTSEGLI